MLSNIKDAQGWLMIIYRLPSTPSTPRVTIWKRIKELGAYLLQQSVYILPNLPQVREAVNQLKEQINQFGGESKIIESASLGEEQEKEVIAGFNSNREEEYVEVIKACKELLREIEEESKTEDFHFADLEENEKHLQRVKELLDNVACRDYFGSPLRPDADALMKECHQKFGEFAREVYSREGIVGEDKKVPLAIDKRHKEKRTLSKKEMVSKFQEIIDNLNNGVLEVDGKRVSELFDGVVMGLEYQEHKNDKALEIKLEWASRRVPKKV